MKIELHYYIIKIIESERMKVSTNKLVLEKLKDEKEEYDKQIRNLDYKIVETSVEIQTKINMQKNTENNDTTKIDYLNNDLEKYRDEESKLTNEFFNKISSIKTSLREILDSKEFKDFTKNLNTNLTLKEKYEFYKQTHPTPKVEPIGSMTNTEAGKSFKDSYTEEEISKLSLEDLSDDRVWNAVRKSMTKKG